MDLPAADARAAVVVPKLGDLVANVAGFLEAATRTAGAGALPRIRENFARQFGFDPLLASAYEALGLDLDGGLLIFTEGTSPEPLLAVPVKDPALFEAKLRRLVETTDGANRFSETTRHGSRVVTAGRAFGTEVVPAFHWAYVGRFALVARESGVAGLEQALLRLTTQKGSLRADPAFLRLGRRVPDGPLQFFVRGNAADQALQSNPDALSSGAMTSLRIDSRSLNLDVFVDLVLPGLVPALHAEPTLALASRVADDAVVLGLTRAAHKDAVAVLRHHPLLNGLLARALGSLGQAAGVDTEHELLPLLAGPATFSVHVQNLADLPKQLKEGAGLDRLLDVLQVAMTVEVNDAQAFWSVLQRSQDKLAARGVRLRRRAVTVGKINATIFEPDRPQPRLGWAIAGNYYVYGAGTGRLEQALQSLDLNSSQLPQRLQGSVGGELAAQPGVSVLVLRLGQLSESVAHVTMGDPQAAVGLGVLLGAALAVTRRLGDVALAVSGEPDGLRLQVRERLQ